MLDRIRRKLFLSLKVMNNDTAPPDGTQADGAEEQNGSLKRNELMAILRKGSSAISGVDSGLTLSQFLSLPIEDILQASRVHDDVYLILATKILSPCFIVIRCTGLMYSLGSDHTVLAQPCHLSVSKAQPR